MNPPNKRALAILVPASLILIWRVAVLVSGRAPATAGAHVGAPLPASDELEAPAVVASVRPAIVADDALMMLQARRGKLAWGRDPFGAVEIPKPPPPEPVEPEVVEAPAPQAPEAPQWLLTGVSRCATGWVAILGGQIVSRGDRLDDRYDVTSVTSQGVVVGDGDWEHVFRLGEKGAETRAKRRLP